MMNSTFQAGGVAQANAVDSTIAHTVEEKEQKEKAANGKGVRHNQSEYKKKRVGSKNILKL